MLLFLCKQSFYYCTASLQPLSPINTLQRAPRTFDQKPANSEHFSGTGMNLVLGSARKPIKQCTIEPIVTKCQISAVPDLCCIVT